MSIKLKSPGTDHVLYHVKKRITASDEFNIVGGNPMSSEHIVLEDDVKSLISVGVPETKARFMARFMDEKIKITKHYDDYDYTIAIGYREDIKALVITYAIPDINDVWMYGSNKVLRKKGFAIATGRLEKAMEEKIIMSDEGVRPIHRRIKRDLAVYISRAFKFFKDKQIDDMCVYSHEGRLVYITDSE
jgi:hypothetical protein